jgi:hypothetical protein
VSTLAELRSALRVVLNDGDQAAGYMWSDGQLNRYLADAVRAYGRHFPRELATSFAIVDGQATYPLPDGCDRVVRAEIVAAGNSEGELLVEGGDAYGWGYRVFGGALILTETPRAALGELKVEYAGAHADLVDDHTASSVPAGDEEMLLALAAAKAADSLVADDAKRAQFEGRAGRSAVDASAGYSAGWESAVRTKGRRMRAGRLVGR